MSDKNIPPYCGSWVRVDQVASIHLAAGGVDLQKTVAANAVRRTTRRPPLASAVLFKAEQEAAVSAPHGPEQVCEYLVLRCNDGNMGQHAMRSDREGRIGSALDRR